MADDHAPRLRVATYNVHGCIGMDRVRSEKRIAEVIASLEADLVGLQELDLGRVRSAGVDQAALIAAQLGWERIFLPAMRRADEQYGNAILSRYPLRLERAVELPGTGSWYCRETRVALWAVAQTDFGNVHVLNTHFGLGRAERFAQARFLAAAVGAAPMGEPLLLLGDFNSLPTSRSIAQLRVQLRSVRALLPQSGLCRTFPTRLPSVAVDHIFVNAFFDAKMLSVNRTPLARVASDHYPLVAELMQCRGRIG